jgi:uncharacterized membrane protein YkoI
MTAINTSMLASIAVLGLALSPVQAKDETPALPMGALAHAAQAMEQDSGGKVLEIRLVDEKGEPAFEAAVAQADTVIYLRVTSVSDTVTHISIRELPPWLQNAGLEAYLKSAALAKVPLVDAISKAEAEAKAPAIGAGIAKPLSGGNSVLAYYVEALKGSKRRLLAVDAKTGALIANPETLYENWTPVKLARRLAP